MMDWQDSPLSLLLSLCSLPVRGLSVWHLRLKPLFVRACSKGYCFAYQRCGISKKALSLQKLVILAIAVFLAICSGTVGLTEAESSLNLPPARVHTLPPSLAKIADTADNNYFGQIAKTSLGYLVWSQFPVTIYVQQLENYTDSAADKRYREWVATVKKAIAQWNVYLPLEEISKRELADIVVLRSQPKREVKLNPDTGLYDIPRAVTAKTSYKFYIKQNPAIIAHKMKLEISPNYADISLLATVRHELGHALGIWGHSKNKNDALYFSQVSDPPEISARDVNTLKKIYQQPTKLGWRI